MRNLSVHPSSPTPVVVPPRNPLINVLSPSPLTIHYLWPRTSLRVYSLHLLPHPIPAPFSDSKPTLVEPSYPPYILPTISSNFAPGRLFRSDSGSRPPPHPPPPPPPPPSRLLHFLRQSRVGFKLIPSSLFISFLSPFFLGFPLYAFSSNSYFPLLFFYCGESNFPVSIISPDAPFRASYKGRPFPRQCISHTCWR